MGKNVNRQPISFNSDYTRYLGQILNQFVDRNTNKKVSCVSKRVDEKSVIILTGFSRSHLLSTVGMLDAARIKVIGVSAIAPKFIPMPNFIVSFFHANRFIYRRLLMGQAQVKQLRFTEVLFQIAVRVPNPSKSKVYRFLSAYSFKLFSKGAYRFSKRMKYTNSALLIRSGFGSAFANDSRKIISDASLPHPNVLQNLIATGEMKFQEIDKRDVISKLILDDTSRADVILVNSDFVKESFVYAGVPETKIVVAYLPPTGIFNTMINKPAIVKRDFSKNLRILFAGTLEERKGVREILLVAEAALKMELDFQFKFIGNWGKETQELQDKFDCLMNCEFESWKSQIDLAMAMEKSDVFLFPSRAEGGARVVTEAMCMAMPIITTHNSGSPIRHLRDGILVKPMDHDEIIKWLIELRTNRSLCQNLAENSRRRIQETIEGDTYLKTIRKICEV